MKLRMVGAGFYQARLHGRLVGVVQKRGKGWEAHPVNSWGLTQLDRGWIAPTRGEAVAHLKQWLGVPC